MTGLPASDVLRPARRAVLEQRFLEARGELDRLPSAAQALPEWKLLHAMTAWRLGDYTESHRAAREAGGAYRTLGDSDGDMRAENVAAAGAFALGRLAEADRGFGRALMLAEALGDELMIARASNNLGNVAFYLGDHTEALGFYRVAGAAFGRVPFLHGIAEAAINIGIVWRDLGRLDEAAAAAEEALEAGERAGSPRVIAQALVGRGEASAGLGDRRWGRTQVERGLAIARQEGDPLATAEGLRVLCVIAREAGELEEAERFGNDALEIVSARQHTWGMAEVQRELGDLFQRGGRTGPARKAFQAAADAFAALGAEVRAAAMEARSSSLPN